MRRSLICAVVITALASSSRTVRAEETLRIAVAQVTSEVAISGPGLVVVDRVTGKERPIAGPVVFAPTASGIALNGEPVASTHLEVRTSETLRVRGLALERAVDIHWERRGGRARLIVVHTVPIERYVAATVSSEVPGSWPIETLKAQAVASRTFAVFRKFSAPDRPYHMEAGVIDQVYGGARIHPRASEATRLTLGEVLTHRRRPIKAYFHSCCAGHTESAREGWGQRLPYLPGSPCRWDRACPAQRYTARIPISRLIEVLRRARLKVSRVDRLRIVDRTATGRVAKMVLDTDRGTVDLSGEDLRRLVGYSVIKSRHFDARLEGDSLVVAGQGSGHGVGLCQWGARGMGAAGKSYRDILVHYYPKTRILRMY